ncbi:esterase-like activity of phytase family protein (plasmid) [Bacillus megaterium]|nr:esterase-like activity of phytase family protein [Priestia megaterium]
MTTLGLSVLDNIEGISWGPKLPNGHDSLVLVSDDNFNRNQVTQFLAFEVLPNRDSSAKNTL